jgi:predicted DCC family thiol-disulfide oxidoreductase YuxK
VNFIIQRDRKDYFKFSPLQSEFANEFFSKNNIENNFDSIVLIENEKLYKKSTAALKIAKHLNGLWKLAYVFIIIPPFVRNFLYDIIAKYRYKWFGRKDTCMIPDEKIKRKFI